MDINFNWKYSLLELPKENDKIFVVCNYWYGNTIISGRFSHKDSNYNKYNKYNIVGREMIMKTTIYFGNTLSYDLTDTFFWDYATEVKFNIPDNKYLRKIKLNLLL